MFEILVEKRNVPARRPRTQPEATLHIYYCDHKDYIPSETLAIVVERIIPLPKLSLIQKLYEISKAVNVSMNPNPETFWQKVNRLMRISIIAIDIPL